MATQPPAPDDDNARFAKWVRDVGPTREMPDPDPDVPTPVVVAIAVLIFLAVVAATVGWVLFAYVVHLGAWNTNALVLMIIGTGGIIAGVGLAYARRRRQ